MEVIKIVFAEEIQPPPPSLANLRRLNFSQVFYATTDCFLEFIINAKKYRNFNKAQRAVSVSYNV